MPKLLRIDGQGRPVYEVEPEPPSTAPLARIVAGLSVGEGSWPTCLSILSAVGSAPNVSATCLYIKRFDAAIPVSGPDGIAAMLAGMLKLARLRENFEAVRSPIFDGVKVELILDASLAGQSDLISLQGLRATGALDVRELIGLYIVNSAALSPAEHHSGITFYRIPRSDLGKAMSESLKLTPPLFRIERSVDQAMQDAFKREIGNFQGRLVGRDDELVNPRSASHDDVLLSTMAALWQAHRPRVPILFGSYAPSLELRRAQCEDGDLTLRSKLLPKPKPRNWSRMDFMSWPRGDEDDDPPF
jgi:hypothetical protein